MNTQKHTPGPWIVKGPSKDIHSKKHGFLFATRYLGNSKKELSERQANARIVAAAPDLLSATEDVLWLIENSTSREWNKNNEAAARSRLSAAIAKALGKTS